MSVYKHVYINIYIYIYIYTCTYLYIHVMPLYASKYLLRGCSLFLLCPVADCAVTSGLDAGRWGARHSVARR